MGYQLPLLVWRDRDSDKAFVMRWSKKAFEVIKFEQNVHSWLDITEAEGKATEDAWLLGIRTLDVRIIGNDADAVFMVRRLLARLPMLRDVRFICMDGKVSPMWSVGSPPLLDRLEIYNLEKWESADLAWTAAIPSLSVYASGTSLALSLRAANDMANRDVLSIGASSFSQQGTADLAAAIANGFKLKSLDLEAYGDCSAELISSALRSRSLLRLKLILRMPELTQFLGFLVEQPHQPPPLRRNNMKSWSYMAPCLEVAEFSIIGTPEDDAGCIFWGAKVETAARAVGELLARMPALTGLTLRPHYLPGLFSWFLRDLVGNVPILQKLNTMTVDASDDLITEDELSLLLGRPIAGDKPIYLSRSRVRVTLLRGPPPNLTQLVLPVRVIPGMAKMIKENGDIVAIAGQEPLGLEVGEACRANAKRRAFWIAATLHIAFARAVLKTAPAYVHSATPLSKTLFGLMDADGLEKDTGSMGTFAFFQSRFFQSHL
jgi:hypothetical protein